MRIVFVSNFLNHHQVPLCEELKLYCSEFTFIATENVSNIGYQTMLSAEYVVNYFDENNQKYCERLIIDSDVVIFGSCPNDLIELRMKENRLSFLFSERFFKKGTWRRFIPSTRKKVENRIVKYKKAPIYVLCASAYLSHDLALLGFPREKCYRWGYFPEFKKYENINKIIDNKIPYSILWVGRFIDWKHPEIAIKIAKQLKNENISFEMNIIGSGPLYNHIKKLIERNNLEKSVHMVGSIKQEKVREYMEQSKIFLFTSDQNEGWGAVLNESMNSGCAVIANRSIGSVPYLLKHYYNGLVYDDETEVLSLIKEIINNNELCMELGTNAYSTMTEMWNAKIAAGRFIAMIDEIKKHGSCDLYNNGPCSKDTN